MALRDAIRNWLGVDGRIRDVLRNELAARSLPQASEIEELRKRLDATEKKLKMTMGSMQASSAQLMGLHDAVDKAKAAAAQADQKATTAKATAEATADGLEGTEELVKALMTKLTEKPAPRKRASSSKSKTSKTSKTTKTR